MKRIPDLTGQTFGNWTVLGPAMQRGNRRMWLCECQCGTKKAIYQNNLRGGKSKSCGCLQKTMMERIGYGNRIYEKGVITSKEYKTWKDIKFRCGTDSGSDAKNYRQRGITVCERWLEAFDNFFADMGPAPGPHWSIGRIDNNAGYSPENCRWETRTEQNRNKRNVKLYSLANQSMTLPEWAEKTGMPVSVLRLRIRRGWTFSDAISIPLGCRSKKDREHFAMHRS